MFWENDKKARMKLLIMVVGMFAIGTIAALVYGNYFLLGDFVKQNNDDVRYIRTAMVLLEQGRLVYYGNDPTLFIMPLFPMLLAGIFKLFGSGDLGLTAIRLIQVMLQCASLYVLYFFVRALFDRRLALLAALLTVLYIPEYVAANFILTEILFKFIFILLAYLAWVAIQKKSVKFYILSGILLALACLIRPNMIVFPAVVFVMWLIQKYKFKEIIKYATIVAVIFVVMMSPWWIRNFNLTQRFVPFTDSSANPFLLGVFVHWQPPSFANEIPKELKYQDYVDRKIMTEQEQKDLGMYIVKTGFQKEPLLYLYWFTIGKTAQLFFEVYYWKPIFGIDVSVALLMQAIYVICALAGLVLMLRRKLLAGKYLGMILLSYVVVLLFFITFSRYAYPLMQFMIVGMAYLLRETHKKFLEGSKWNGKGLHLK